MLYASLFITYIVIFFWVNHRLYKLEKRVRFEYVQAINDINRIKIDILIMLDQDRKNHIKDFDRLESVINTNNADRILQCSAVDRKVHEACFPGVKSVKLKQQKKKGKK